MRNTDVEMNDTDRDVQLIGRMADVPTILEVVCRTTGMGFAAVARVTDKKWVACSVLDNIHFGLKPGGELQLESTICHEIRQSHQLVVIDHVDEDPHFRTHHTPLTYGFQSYISVPIIRRDGTFFGTLCAIDPAPAKVQNPETIGMFTLFAKLIASNLDSNQDLVEARAHLAEERELSEVREQFIAVLGHDLRNPLAALMAGIRRLSRVGVGDGGQDVLAAMQSSAVRMRDLVDNVMDFARARLGDGLKLETAAKAPLRPVLEHIVDEIRTIYPQREIKTDFQLDQDVHCDHPRISQLLSNLLGNAVTHGDPAIPIEVGGKTTGSELQLWVTNGGAPISKKAMETLFRPFFRGEVRGSQQGLGLGLFIASEIARVHDGRISVISTPDETRFTFTMPL
ncbi:signal transduction histidine kinase [Pararhizobium capsulatum DSM 1112]|uniref:histidine kinase n=1 Tax=Pararhizobium capsulatum DSM 1112 TaxID=1121113 RepID=A0ABU0BRP4_9HYPH|nr:GAF domain-containing sensor histidine kinase [Pararhizobium capsulatum]MDQ0320928.1 signal transduction histidine kinase [Pararhizobium capsulatum DSM 1112]